MAKDRYSGAMTSDGVPRVGEWRHATALESLLRVVRESTGRRAAFVQPDCSHTDWSHLGLYCNYCTDLTTQPGWPRW